MEKLTFFINILLVGCILYGDANQNSCHIDGCWDGPGRMKCQSCKSGCFGQNCSRVCIGQCDMGACNRTTGECFKCKPGWYGLHCDITCPDTCLSLIDDNHAHCERQTGSCQQHCDGGKTRSHCLNDCPANCKLSVCTMLGGECLHGCQDGWGGPYCNRSCENCFNGRCAGDGYCTQHCKIGFYGDRCDKKCPHCYNTGCDRQTGSCEACYPSYYGHNCEHICSDTCYKGKDGHRHCQRIDGRCLEGCESGWHGTQCKIRCSPHCKHNECFSHDGYCAFPCEKGRYGSHCKSLCSEHCKTGACMRHDGRCIDGCKNGWHGSQCTNSKHTSCCKNGRCKRQTGLCFDVCGENCDECEQNAGNCLRCSQDYEPDNGRCKFVKNEHVTRSSPSGAFHCSSEAVNLPLKVLLLNNLLKAFY